MVRDEHEREHGERKVILLRAPFAAVAILEPGKLLSIAEEALDLPAVAIQGGDSVVAAVAWCHPDRLGLKSRPVRPPQGI